MAKLIDDGRVLDVVTGVARQHPVGERRARTRRRTRTPHVAGRRGSGRCRGGRPWPVSRCRAGRCCRVPPNELRIGRRRECTQKCDIPAASGVVHEDETPSQGCFPSRLARTRKRRSAAPNYSFVAVTVAPVGGYSATAKVSRLVRVRSPSAPMEPIPVRYVSALPCPKSPRHAAARRVVTNTALPGSPGASWICTGPKPASRSISTATCSPQAVPRPTPPAARETVRQCRVLTA